MKSTGYIVNGVYVKMPYTYMEPTGDTPTYKGWSHDMQRQEHRAELVQPYIGEKPNPEFIQLYPDQAAQYGFIKPKE